MSKNLVLNKYEICLKMLEMTIFRVSNFQKFLGEHAPRLIMVPPFESPAPAPTHDRKITCPAILQPWQPCFCSPIYWILYHVTSSCKGPINPSRRSQLHNDNNCFVYLYKKSKQKLFYTRGTNFLTYKRPCARYWLQFQRTQFSHTKITITWFIIELHP